MQYALLGFAFLALITGLTDGQSLESVPQNEQFCHEHEVNVTFQLYTRKNINDGVTLILGDKAKLLASGFQGSLPTLIITHGYSDDATTSWMQTTKREVLDGENANIITLDWSECSKNVIYNEVIECMKEAGIHTGEFLKFLQDVGNFNVGKAHLIGHSLGAHLMGFAAKAFPMEKTIGRITGLDPAGPLFEHAGESERLNSNSAKLVDVIHTCRVFLGIRKPVGTIDFYPNGGYNQIGCENTDLRCHHAKSREYFIKTISTNAYPARKCETLEDAVKGECDGESAVMGYRLKFRTPGIYYVKIN